MTSPISPSAYLPFATATGTSGTTGSAGTTGSTGATTPVNPSSQMDENTFLQLLVAQLKYQDPNNPTDPTQFISQTATFTMVQTLNAIQQQNTQLLADQGVLGGSSLIGRQVTYLDSATNASATGVVSAASYDSTNGIQLTVGGVKVPLSAVQEVQAASTS